MKKFYSLTEENITDMLAALSLEPEWLRMAQENPQLLVVMVDSERLRSAPFERPKHGKRAVDIVSESKTGTFLVY